MCGIFGVWRKDGAPVCPEALERSVRLLAHRGPDAEAVLLRNALGFGHRRLKIIDLSAAANQPFTDGKDTLVYNGEVFNYRALRQELARHYPFATQSDTEVLFRALQHWGPDALERLDGQFAFAFHSAQDHTLLLARDHVGICPLYILESPDWLAFSSEIKPLLAYGGPRALNPQGVLDYFAYRYNIQNGHTLFDGVRRQHPAHYTLIDLHTGRRATHRYWRMHFGASLPEKDVQDAVNATLDAVLQEQLVADVPVGLFLSGGVDSRAVLHGVSKCSPPLNAYTLAFSEQDPELERVQALAGRYAFNSHVFRYHQSPESIRAALASLEEPFGDVIICANSLLARQAAAHTRVVLSGEGGDESFLGYDHQRALLKLRRLGRIPGFRQVAPSLLQLMPSALLARLGRLAGAYGPTEKKHIAGVIQRLHSPVDAYLHMIRLYPRDAFPQMFSPRFLASSGGEADEAPFRTIFKEEGDVVRALLRAEIEQATLIVNLLKQDRLCMAHSLEARVPLVSRKVLAMVGRMPSGSLAASPVKHALQYYADNTPLPKKAFSVAASPQYVHYLRVLWKEYVSPAIAQDGSLFNREFLMHVEATLDAQGLLDLKRAMAVVMFFAWRQSFAGMLRD